MSIGENIKQLRKQRNMTQKQLATETGLAVITIQQYEAEKYNPKINALNKLCIALDCKITDLIDEDSKKYYRMFDHLEKNEQRLQEEVVKKAPKFTAYDENGNEIKDRPIKFTSVSRSHAQTEAYDLFHSLLSEDWIMTQEQEVIAVQLRDILSIYSELNDTGREMAVKRVEELRYSNFMTDSQQDDIYFDRIKEKINNGEKLAPDEIEWWHNYLDNSVKTVGAIFESLFSMLNKEGRRKAHTQINRAIDQIELLTKIPEYQKESPKPPEE